MRRIYFTKGVGIIFMLLAMVFGCTQVSENLNENNSGAENKPSNDTTPITVTLIGADGTELKVINATAGERVLLSSVSVENLSHWNTAADGSGLSYKGAAVFSESVTLYAILLAENAHVINYMLGGGMNNPQNPYSFTEDDYIGLKNPTRDGYTFAGWYEDKAFSGKAIKGWTAGDKTTDVTLYAKWEKENSEEPEQPQQPVLEITITFDVNGGTEAAPEAIKTISGKNVELPEMGNNFSHWNTKSDGSGLSYKGAAVFSESVTLYAILLAKNAHVINYMLGGGMNNPQNPYSFTEDDYIGLKNPTRDGYTFAGWYENKTFTGKAIKGWAAGDKIADVTLYAKWKKENSEEPQQPENLNGKGVYSYTVNIADISTAWGGSVKSPAFSIVLLTDKQLEACRTAADFKQATAANPEYQIGAYGNMKITDTNNPGNFAVYGANPVNDEYQYYTGVAAAVTATTFTLTVDMTKLVLTDLKALFAANAAGKDEAMVTEDDIVNLKGYKPYVLALSDLSSDENNYQMTAWSADLMTMTAGTEFPANPIKSTPAIPTCKDLNFIAGSTTNWEHTPLINNTFVFIANTYTYTPNYASNDEFAFTNGSWDFKACGVTIATLDKNFLLREGGGNITFADGVLAIGNVYTVTLIVKGNHEAYVKISELEEFTVSSIKINDSSAKIYGIGIEPADLKINLSVTTEDNLVFTKKVTADMISDFDSSTVGTKTLTITYKGENTTFDIEIIDPSAVAAANAAGYISALSDGEYTVAVTGTITSDTISAIKTALRSNSNTKVNLDLSQTTGLTKIGAEAFYGCYNLVGITIPDSVTSIGDKAFSNCDNLTNVTIGNSVTSIGDFAFYGCNSLTSITIPDSVTSIGNSAFSNCGSLTSLTVADGNTTYKSYENCIYTIDGQTLVVAAGGLASITILDGVTSIGNSVFSNCYRLTSIIIPDSVTSIGDNAFSNCGKLTSVTIGDGVTSIGDSAFSDCNGLTSITIPDSVISIGDSTFSDCGNLASVTIGDGVTSIGDSAFSDCNGLTSIIIPDSVTSIDDNAFSNCGKLTSVTIGDGVTSIGDSAFSDCNGLTSITIPDSVISIGDSTFSNCRNLTNVTIGNGVTSIGSRAFGNCRSLTTVNYRGTQEQWETITIGSYNTLLKRATINYDYTGE